MRRTSLVAVALAVLIPAVGHAQFKPKLPRVGLGGGKKEQTVPPPKFNDRVLEIEERHVLAFLADLKEEGDSLEAARARYVVARKAYEDSVKAFPAREAAYNRQKAAWDKCADGERAAMKKNEREMQAAQDELTGGDEDAYQAAMQKVAGRIQAAAQAGNMAEVQRLTDSIQKSMAKVNEAAMRAGKQAELSNSKCGPEPEEPQRPYPPTMDRPRLTRPGSSKLGLTGEQWAIMYDRMLPLLWIEKPEDYERATENGFSPKETASLRQHGGQLRAAHQRNQALQRMDV